MADDSTIVITDIKAALSESDLAASGKPAALLVVGGDLNRTLFDLTAKETTAGRNPDNNIQLEYPGISRHHLKVSMDEGGGNFSIEDLGSKNGTYLNNQKLDNKQPLKKGDIIKIGSIAFKYIPEGDPERNAYDKLNLEANTDLHTGCYNKAYFNKSLESEYKKSRLTGSPLSLIIFDLDHFKKLNDNYGHDAGDYVLKEMAHIVRINGVREQDIFGRYGGEEFVILLPQTNLKQAFEIAERLRKLVEAHVFTYDSQRLPVTASVGVADYRKGVQTALDLFKRADAAVYKSKENGRNQVQFYRD